MAEGIEEVESNSNSNGGDATSSMIVYSNIGSVKHEFETYQQTVHHSKISPRCQSPSLPITSNHQIIDSNNYLTYRQSPKQHKQTTDCDQDNQSNSSHQDQPINLKSEVIE